MRGRLLLLPGLVSVLGLVWLFAGGWRAPAPGPSAPLAGERNGAALFAAAGCANCHTDRQHHGALLAGGRALVTPFGTFFTPNISSDPTSGIGRWSDADFLRALRLGVSPAGRDYYPSFPYPAFTQMSDGDILAIKRYIFALPAQRRPNHDHVLRFPYNIRAGIKLWKILYLREGSLAADPDQSKEWNRGAYLVRAVAHCGECHTPRNWLGGLKTDRRFAGADTAVDGMKAPNITPDPRALGHWSVADIASYLDDGITPSGDSAGGAMAEVVRGTSALSAEDRHAIAVYVKAQPAIAPSAAATVPHGD